MYRSTVFAATFAFFAAGVFGCSNGSQSGSPRSSTAADSVGCGQDGQPCCGTDSCSGSLACIQLGDGFDGNNVCGKAPPSATCGLLGQACCGDSVECRDTSVCDETTGTCVAPEAGVPTPCGQIGQACCEDGVQPACVGSAVCFGGSITSCVDPATLADASVPNPTGPCGEAGQPCCGTDTCSGSLSCLQLGNGFDGNNVCGTAPPSPTCGLLGQACCGDSVQCRDSSVCDVTSGVCVANEAGPPPCGQAGQPCCFDGSQFSCTGSAVCMELSNFICVAQ
jgi:hypothetical protein